MIKLRKKERGKRVKVLKDYHKTLREFLELVLKVHALVKGSLRQHKLPTIIKVGKSVAVIIFDDGTVTVAEEMKKGKR